MSACFAGRLVLGILYSHSSTHPSFSYVQAVTFPTWPDTAKAETEVARDLVIVVCVLPRKSGIGKKPDGLALLQRPTNRLFRSAEPQPMNMPAHRESALHVSLREHSEDRAVLHKLTTNILARMQPLQYRQHDRRDYREKRRLLLLELTLADYYVSKFKRYSLGKIFCLLL